MDHMMPGLDGVKYEKLPIVALTANVVGDVRDMFMQNGLDDFLSKPLEMHEIERVLRQWLPKGKCVAEENKKGV